MAVPKHSLIPKFFVTPSTERWGLCPQSLNRGLGLPGHENRAEVTVPVWGQAVRNGGSILCLSLGTMPLELVPIP